MRRLFALILVVLVGAAFVLAQEATQPRTQDRQTGKSDKKKDEKNKDKDQRNAPDTSVFSDSVANNVLTDLRDGLEGHSQRLMLSAFDADKMNGYLTFKDQIQTYFDRYESFRVYYRIAQSTVEGTRGIVLVDFELEQSPRNATTPPSRKSAQLRFELERGNKGWKIVDFRPRGFFS